MTIDAPRLIPAPPCRRETNLTTLCEMQMAKLKRPARAHRPKGREGSSKADWYTDADIDAMIAAVGSIPDASIDSKFLAPDGKLCTWRTTSRPVELADQVRGAGGWFQVRRSFQGKAPPSRIAKDLKSLATAAAHLQMVLTRFNPNAPRKPEATQLLRESMRQWVLKEKGHTDTEIYAELYPRSVPVRYQSPGSRNSESGPYRDREYEAILQWIEMVERLTRVAIYAETIARKLMRTGRNGTEARNKGDVALRQFIGDLKEIYRDVFAREPGYSRPPRGGSPHGPFVRFVDAALRPLGVAISAESIASYIRPSKPSSKRS